MKFTNKMMDSMMGKMSKEEKQKIMEQFLSGMSEEEKKEMMKQMMGGKMSMMDMMSFMMGGEAGESATGTKPWDMCGEMMSSMSKKGEKGKIDALVTPEIREIFEEWVQQINDEIMELLKDKSSMSTGQIAEHLKISNKSVIYFVAKLAQNEKIKLEVSKHDPKD